MYPKSHLSGDNLDKPDKLGMQGKRTRFQQQFIKKHLMILTRVSFKPIMAKWGKIGHSSSTERIIGT